MAARPSNAIVSLGKRSTATWQTIGGGLLGRLSTLGWTFDQNATRPNMETAGMRYDQATTIVTFSDPLEAQVHRESAGAPISLRILSSLMDLSGWHILFVNDCLPVILSLRKGSNSARLQTDSETVALGVLEAGAKASFLHIPGTEMIAAGTDGASRDGAKQS